MKIKMYYLLLALAALLMSCDGVIQGKAMNVEELLPKTVEIDGCEYIVIRFKTYGINLYGTSIAHKGNCKFCEERRNTHVDSKR